MISKKVFIAQDAFTAFIDRGHAKHVTASAFFRYFAMESSQIYTSPLSISETYDSLYSNISPALAKDFLRAIYLSSVNIIYPESSDLKSAIKAVATTSSAEMTFSKALTSIMCTKRNIPQICTFSYIPSLFGLQTFYLPV